MFRTFFIFLSKLPWAQRLITRWKLAWRFASRFIAGEDRASAMEVVRILNGQGLNATLDFLGENVSRLQDAEASVIEILALLREIHQVQVRANVSIKLSQLGLTLDPQVCRQNVIRLLDAARRTGNFVRIDMEDSSLTQATIDLFTGLREQGYDNMGLVIQSYLFRSAADLAALAPFQPRIRLVKGAYKEPAGVAFAEKRRVDENFDLLTRLLLELTRQAGAPAVSADGLTPPLAAIATHDLARIEYALQTASEMELPAGSFEFQMLYGIRRDLQASLAARGHAVRVYIPYGTRWYPYFMRRLAERPANLWFFVASFFRK